MKQWTRAERYRILQSDEEIRSLHAQIRQSTYRQTYHIQPVTGLLNDPNGFVWHKGQWHLFYQWCPWGAVHGLKYWYHVVSRDLVHWENKGVCIRPDTIYDNKGAYSGSAFPADDGFYIYYTGNHRDDNWMRQSYTMMAELKDNGEFKKHIPPLYGPNPQYTEHQRDPNIIYNEETKRYYIFSGAQTKAKKGRCIIYSSKDLKTGWSFAGEMKVPGFDDFGDMWECPSLERFDGKDVFIFCPQHIHLQGRGDTQNHCGYLIGNMDFDTLTFTPDGSFHVLDFGFDSYAAVCAENSPDPNTSIIIAWMGLPDSGYPTDEENWQGCLTLPRELSIRNRRLIQKPLAQFKQLRQQRIPVDGHLPNTCEMEILITSKDFHCRLFTDAQGDHGLWIRYDDEKREIRVDRSHMIRCFNEEQGQVRTRPLRNGCYLLRLFIDCSSIEIFVNDGDAVFTSRVFPTENEHYFTMDGHAQTTIWKIAPAVKDDFVIRHEI